MEQFLLPIAVWFNAHPQISQNFPQSIKVVQKLCGFTKSYVVLQVCEWQQPLVDWQTPSLTKKKDGEMIQL